MRSSFSFLGISLMCAVVFASKRQGADDDDFDDFSGGLGTNWLSSLVGPSSGFVPDPFPLRQEISSEYISSFKGLWDSLAADVALSESGQSHSRELSDLVVTSTTSNQESWNMWNANGFFPGQSDTSVGILDVTSDRTVTSDNERSMGIWLGEYFGGVNGLPSTSEPRLSSDHVPNGSNGHVPNGSIGCVPRDSSYHVSKEVGDCRSDSESFPSQDDGGHSMSNNSDSVSNRDHSISTASGGEVSSLVSESSLMETKAQVEPNESKTDHGKAQIESGKAQIKSGKAQLESSKAQLESSKAQVENNTAQVEKVSAPVPIIVRMYRAKDLGGSDGLSGPDSLTSILADLESDAYVSFYDEERLPAAPEVKRGGRKGGSNTGGFSPQRNQPLQKAVQVAVDYNSGVNGLSQKLSAIAQSAIMAEVAQAGSLDDKKMGMRVFDAIVASMKAAVDGFESSTSFHSGVKAKLVLQLTSGIVPHVVLMYNSGISVKDSMRDPKLSAEYILNLAKTQAKKVIDDKAKSVKKEIQKDLDLQSKAKAREKQVRQAELAEEERRRKNRASEENQGKSDGQSSPKPSASSAGGVSPGSIVYIITAILANTDAARARTGGPKFSGLSDREAESTIYSGGFAFGTVTRNLAPLQFQLDEYVARQVTRANEARAQADAQAEALKQGKKKKSRGNKSGGAETPQPVSSSSDPISSSSDPISSSSDPISSSSQPVSSSTNLTCPVQPREAESVMPAFIQMHFATSDRSILGSFVQSSSSGASVVATAHNPCAASEYLVCQPFVPGVVLNDVAKNFGLMEPLAALSKKFFTQKGLMNELKLAQQCREHELTFPVGAIRVEAVTANTRLFVFEAVRDMTDVITFDYGYSELLADHTRYAANIASNKGSVATVSEQIVSRAPLSIRDGILSLSRLDTIIKTVSGAEMPFVKSVGSFRNNGRDRVQVGPARDRWQTHFLDALLFQAKSLIVLHFISPKHIDEAAIMVGTYEACYRASHLVGQSEMFVTTIKDFVTSLGDPTVDTLTPNFALSLSHPLSRNAKSGNFYLVQANTFPTFTSDFDEIAPVDDADDESTTAQTVIGSMPKPSYKIAELTFADLVLANRSSKKVSQLFGHGVHEMSRPSVSDVPKEYFLLELYASDGDLDIRNFETEFLTGRMYKYAVSLDVAQGVLKLMKAVQEGQPANTAMDVELGSRALPVLAAVPRLWGVKLVNGIVKLLAQAGRPHPNEIQFTTGQISLYSARQETTMILGQVAVQPGVIDPKYVPNYAWSFALKHYDYWHSRSLWMQLNAYYPKCRGLTSDLVRKSWYVGKLDGEPIGCFLGSEVSDQERSGVFSTIAAGLSFPSAAGVSSTPVSPASSWARTSSAAWKAQQLMRRYLSVVQLIKAHSPANEDDEWERASGASDEGVGENEDAGNDEDAENDEDDAENDEDDAENDEEGDSQGSANGEDSGDKAEETEARDVRELDLRETFEGNRAILTDILAELSEILRSLDPLEAFHVVNTLYELSTTSRDLMGSSMTLLQGEDLRRVEGDNLADWTDPFNLENEDNQEDEDDQDEEDRLVVDVEDVEGSDEEQSAEEAEESNEGSDDENAGEEGSESGSESSQGTGSSEDESEEDADEDIEDNSSAAADDLLSDANETSEDGMDDDDDEEDSEEDTEEDDDEEQEQGRSVEEGYLQYVPQDFSVNGETSPQKALDPNAVPSWYQSRVVIAELQFAKARFESAGAREGFRSATPETRFAYDKALTAFRAGVRFIEAHPYGRLVVSSLTPSTFPKRGYSSAYYAVVQVETPPVLGMAITAKIQMASFKFSGYALMDVVPIQGFLKLFSYRGKLRDRSKLFPFGKPAERVKLAQGDITHELHEQISADWYLGQQVVELIQKVSDSRLGVLPRTESDAKKLGLFSPEVAVSTDSAPISKDFAPISKGFTPVTEFSTTFFTERGPGSSEHETLDSTPLSLTHPSKVSSGAETRNGHGVSSASLEKRAAAASPSVIAASPSVMTPVQTPGRGLSVDSPVPISDTDEEFLKTFPCKLFDGTPARSLRVKIYRTDVPSTTLNSLSMSQAVAEHFATKVNEMQKAFKPTKGHYLVGDYGFACPVPVVSPDDKF